MIKTHTAGLSLALWGTKKFKELQGGLKEKGLVRVAPPRGRLAVQCGD